MDVLFGMDTHQTDADVRDPRFQIVVNGVLTASGRSLYYLTTPVNDILGKMSWTDEDIVMDIGCGNAYKTVYVLIPKIKNYKMLFAVDKNPAVIKYASETCHAKNLEYRVADIENISTFPEECRGTITKIISIDCFHCMQNERDAFRNLFILMAPGGQALLDYRATSPLLEVCEVMAKKPNCRAYIHDILNDFHGRIHNRVRSADFQDMLKETGFKTLFCELLPDLITFRSDEEFKDLWRNTKGLMMKVPTEYKDEFLDEALRIILVVHGRNSLHEPLMEYKRMVLLLKKEM